MPSSESRSTDRGPAILRGALYVMRGVLNQVSGLAGILAFLAEMWNRAPIDEAVYSGVVVGGSVYLILLLVDVALEQIIVAEQRSRLRKEDGEKEEIEVDSAPEKPQADSSSSSPDPDRNSGESASSGDASTSANSSSDSSSENKQLATV